MTDLSLPAKRSFDLEDALLRFAQDWRASALIAAAAVLQQAIGHLNGDDSWFLTFAEKYLGGAVPYVDIFDPNPPAAFLAYVPAVALGRIFGAPPEFFVAILTFLGAGLALLLTGEILRRADLLAPSEALPALGLGLYVLLFVPAFCFSEREHLALIAMLPMTALAAGRAAGGKVLLRDALLAGIGCGLACAFKPYYLLPAAGIVLYGVVARRRLALLLAPEVLAAGGVLLAYALVILAVFPAYLSQALPLILAVYAPLRDRLWRSLLSPLFLANAVLLGGLVGIAGRALLRQPRTLVLAVASAGFLATFLIQGKGWMNHAYPGVGLALLAAASFISAPGAPGLTAARRIFALFVFVPSLCLAPFLFGTLKDFGNGEEYPGLAEAVRRLGPAHPQIAALAEQLDVGHPLVRNLGGTWVGRQNCLWVSWGVRYLLARGLVSESERARLLDYMRADEAQFESDVDRAKPQILLVEDANVEIWARSQAPLRAVLEDYRRLENAGAVEIWRRRPDR